MKIIRTKHFPPRGYKAINLFGVVFARKELSIIDKVHEEIHTQQMKEMLYIGFYLWYCIEFLVRLIIMRNWHKAYRSVSFEQEAYNCEYDVLILKYRKHYAWVKYLKKGGNNECKRLHDSSHTI